MDTVFSSPRKWSASMVKSRAHVWLTSALFASYLALVVWIASDSGFVAGLCAALGPALIQIIILYGLRRLYLDAEAKDASAI